MNGITLGKIFGTIVIAGSILTICACKKAAVPFDIKIINNLSGYAGTYPAFKDEEVVVKPSDMGAGIDQQRLAVYTLNQSGDGLESKIGFTNTNGEIRFVATNDSGYAIVTYTPVQTSKGSLYELVDAHPGLALIARDVKVYRSDDSVYPPTSFPDNASGIIQECIPELDQGLHPGGFILGSIAWASENLATGYTNYNADGYNVPGKACVNWTRIVKQFGDGAVGLRAAKLTFKSEIIERCGNVDDIAGNTELFVEDQALLNAMTSYIFSRN